MNVYLNTGWKLGGILDECIPGYRMGPRMNVYLDTGWKLGGILDEYIPEYRIETRKNTR